VNSLSSTVAALAVSFGVVGSAAGCFFACQDVECESSSEQLLLGGSGKVDGCHVVLFEPYTITIKAPGAFVYPC
jgi:hypothetical protein